MKFLIARIVCHLITVIGGVYLTILLGPSFLLFLSGIGLLILSDTVTESIEKSESNENKIKEQIKRHQYKIDKLNAENIQALLNSDEN